MAVAMTLADSVGVARGDMICRPNNQPSMTQEIEAMVSWMDAQRLTIGTRSSSSTRRTWYGPPSKGCTTRWTSTAFAGTSRQPCSPSTTSAGSGLHTTDPLAIDDYQLNRATGSFILIDPADEFTVGAGTVKFAAQHAPSPERRAPHRQAHRGGEIPTPGGPRCHGLFTGLSGSGKSTLAAAVEELLVKRGHPLSWWTGTTCGTICAATSDSLLKTVQRTFGVGRSGRLLAEDGTVALLSLISPCGEERRKLREAHADGGWRFRDLRQHTVRSLRASRSQGPLCQGARRRTPRLHGYRAVYEVPVYPDLELSPESGDIFDQALQVLPAERGTSAIVGVRFRTFGVPFPFIFPDYYLPIPSGLLFVILCRPILPLGPTLAN